MIFRLHSRLIFWNLLIITLMAGILGYFLISSIRGDFEAQIEERLVADSALAATFLENLPATADLDELADRIARLLDVRVTIIAHDGRVLGDSDLIRDELQTVENHRSRPEVMEAVERGTGTAVRWSPTVRVQFIYVARHVEPYIIRLALPASATDKLLADLRSRLALATLVGIGLTLIFGLLVRGLISVPLRQLSSASRKLAAGDLNQRLPISGDEEIAALGNSLNTMAKNLNNQMHALVEGKQRLELIVGAMAEGVMVLDTSGRISMTNRAIHALVGSDRDLIGKTPLEVFRIPDVENAVKLVFGGAGSQVVEITMSNNRIVQANVAPVANVGGIVDAVVIVFHDLTEIRRTEKMRRDFVANVSHEFKTPLTSIRGYAETLLSGALHEGEIAFDFLRTIERNARHLETLVTDLLTLARIEAELPISIETINVKSLIDELIGSRRAAIHERSLKVLNEAPSIDIRVDRLRLAVTLSNLLDNAIYYNRPGGEIRVHGELADGSLQLNVSDTGQGIPADELPRIFERFYRVDKARSRESGRTGLGLSIVKHAMEGQGGSVAVSSRIGIGTTFTIKVPVSEEKKAAG